MKFIRAVKNKYLFQLGHREKDLLLNVLELYPRIPPTYQRLSKSGGLPDQEGSQELLDEALAEQRTENKKQLQALLADSERLKENEAGWRLSLAPAEVEWLLQILNDIRLGSWITLGSPEQWAGALNEETIPHLWAMEVAGSFQMRFLEALEGRG